MSDTVYNLIAFDDFAAVEMRIGTIISAEFNPKAKKPAYVIQVDFGAQIGTRISSAQLTHNYSPEQLIGMQIVAVLNFPAKHIAGVESQILILGALCPDHDVVLLTPTLPVRNGSTIG